MGFNKIDEDIENLIGGKENDDDKKPMKDKLAEKNAQLDQYLESTKTN